MSEIKLTKNQALVLEVLESHQSPLTAYMILERLNDSGLRAPPQVYRCLLYTSPSPRDATLSRMPSSA